MAKLQANADPAAELMAGVCDEFGYSVAITSRTSSASGELLVVGSPNAPGNYRGSAYIFGLIGGKWTFRQRLVGSSPGDYFGNVVALSDRTIAVGTHPGYGPDTSGLETVYVFTPRANGMWEQQAPYMARVSNPHPIGGHRFGESLSLDQDTLAVGAPDDDEFLISAGAAYIYKRSGDMWPLSSKVIATDQAENDKFGMAVSISGYTLAVSAHGSTDRGSVYVFAETGSNETDWIQQMKVIPQHTAQGDKFGASVGLSDTYLAAGAPGKNSAGAAYVHRCVTTTTTTTMTIDLTPPTPLPVQDNLLPRAISSYSYRDRRLSYFVTLLCLLVGYAL
jgi:hypothetical protein